MFGVELGLLCEVLEGKLVVAPAVVGDAFAVGVLGSGCSQEDVLHGLLGVYYLVLDMVEVMR